ncbi:response regulator transcription factor [Paraburkholderia sediminicola]|uniref:response regulator transcription factor n=1 Tax=Paraburkholderia sediminicola TaxID=458836 RepID=UPI0038BC9638
MPDTIALIEDDLATATLLQRHLHEAGYATILSIDGREAIQSLRKHAYALVILGWELPVIPGIEVVEWVRTNLGEATPVMFATHRCAEEDIVGTLQRGADEFLVKPVHRAGFPARVDALLHRTRKDPSGIESLCVGRYSINLQRTEIQLAVQRVMLTPCEFKVARHLFENMGRLVSYSELVHVAWAGELDPPSRTLDAHIAKIRKNSRLGGKIACVWPGSTRWDVVSKKLAEQT